MENCAQTVKSAVSELLPFTVLCEGRGLDPMSAGWQVEIDSQCL